MEQKVVQYKTIDIFWKRASLKAIRMLVNILALRLNDSNPGFCLFTSCVIFNKILNFLS